MPTIANPAPLLELDDHLSAEDFERISRLVEGKTGIRMPPNKSLLAEGRLRKRMRAVGMSSLPEYCAWLFKGDGFDKELQYFINVLTTNKTDFYREPSHYAYLEHSIVPELLKHRTEHTPLIKIWSAACSIGAEAYTAAMVLQEMKREGERFRFAVLGTDISTDVLEQGRQAVYPMEFIEPVPEPLRSHYVMHARRPRGRDEIRIVPELRRFVNFRHLNLMDAHYPFDRDVDVIFLRNVLIYFNRQVQQDVIGRIIDHLRPGGYLMLGHSESMIGTGFPLAQVAPATFRKN